MGARRTSGTTMPAGAGLVLVAALSWVNLAGDAGRPSAVAADRGALVAAEGSPAPAPGATTPVIPRLSSNASTTLAVTAPLTVTATDGELTSVEVTGPDGAVTGTLSADRHSWSAAGVRIPSSEYRISAVALGPTGGRGTLERSFTTPAPSRTFTADISPWGDDEVGVGQPIVARLSTPARTARARAAVEAALDVTADRPLGPAAWSWISDRELHFRPRDFWPGHTTVQIRVGLSRATLGGDRWGTGDRVLSFRVGRALVMRISDDTHQMTVTRDGSRLRTIPVSMGQPGYTTRSGIKTIMSREDSVRMTSASYGGSDFYDVTVQDAQRLTWSGEFIHAAPRTVGAQGHRNVSHGCVNISPANAAWLIERTLIGDPVITTGTGRQMEPGNGTGGDWNLSWRTWLAGSALGVAAG